MSEDGIYMGNLEDNYGGYGGFGGCRGSGLAGLTNYGALVGLAVIFHSISLNRVLQGPGVNFRDAQVCSRKPW